MEATFCSYLREVVPSTFEENVRHETAFKRWIHESMQKENIKF